MATEILNVTAAEIEYGDLVTVGRDQFWAHTAAELDQWGDINVSDGNKFRTFLPKSSVQVTREVKAEAYSYN